MPSTYVDQAIASFDGTFTTDHPLGGPKPALVSTLRHIGCNRLMCEAIAAELTAAKIFPKSAVGYHMPYLGEDVRNIVLTIVGDRF